MSKEIKNKAFFDIDGTLLYENEENLRPEVIASVKQLQAAGFEIYIATGRCLGQAKHILKQLEITDGVFANGQTIIKNDEIIYHHTVTNEISEQILQFAKNNKVYPAVIRREGMFLNCDLKSRIVKYKLRKYAFGGVNLKKIGNEANQGFWFFGSNLNEIASKIDDNYFNVSVYGKTTLEIMPKAFNKADGIKKLLNYEHGLVYAFGDGRNDCEMIDYADVGIVMGNANDELKAQATYVTAPNNQGGITQAINYILKQED